MQIKTRFMQIRKVVIALLLEVGILFSTFAGSSIGLPATRAQEQVPDNFSPEIIHLWSPVSNTVLYWSLNTERGGPGLLPYNLNLYHAETDQHYVLAKDGYAGPAKFSLDGSTISFWYDNVPYLVWLGDEDIVTRRADTDNVPVKGGFSSNNELLIYTTEGNEVRVRNVVTNVETDLGVFENISTLPFLFPEWSPNDQWVAFGMEANGVLLDPAGVEEPILLADWKSPESEFSSATHFFAWSSDGSSLYDYRGNLLHNFTAQAAPIASVELQNLSSDGAFEILYLDGELFLQRVSAGTRKQLTANQITIEEILSQEEAPPASPDIIALAVVDGFDYPVGKPNGTGYNTTAGCWWLQRDGACAPGPHPGQDFNGNGGGDSDLGHPVYAVANGTVVFSAVGSGTAWGNIIMIEHTLPDGSKVWSQYAHLQNRYVSSGTVNKGDQIGTIGKGYNNIYYAHLHFEIRIKYRAADAWITGWSDDLVREYYAKPDDYINSHRVINPGTDCNSISGTGIKLFDGINCTSSEKHLSQTGFTNLPDFNDRATSIYVSSGWSARVYQDDNRGGSSRCIDHSMWDLDKDYYTSGDTGRKINNDISSLEVYNNSSCTGGSAPNVPSNLRNSSSTPTSITMTWDDVSNESGYKIYQWNGSSFVHFATVGANTTSYTETRSSCGWTNRYAVTAYNGNGESGLSDWEDGYAQSCPLPSTPSNFRITGSTQTSISMAWDDVSNETGYKIYEWNGAEFVYLASVGANVTTFTDTRSECGWDEFYEVSAYNGNGESEHTGWIYGTTKPCNPTLITPASDASYPHDYELTFEWEAMREGTEYFVEWWGGPYSTMQPCQWITGNTCYVGTVYPGHTYSWHVKARNSAGESNWSDTWTFTVQNESTPDLVVESITASPASPRVNQPVTFTVRIKNQGTGDVSSNFYLDLYIDSEPVTNCSDSGSHWWSINSLNAGTAQDFTYTYQGFSSSGTHNLYAFADTNCDISESIENNNIRGPVALNVQQVQLPGGFNKSSPANGLTGQPINLTLTWQPSAGATSYQYCYDTTNDNACSPWVSNGTATSKTLSGLSYSTTYYWHVRAVNAAGKTFANGAPTAFWSFRTQGTPVQTTFASTVDDGWVLESTEASNTGGTLNATTATFNVGDDAGDRQFRGILSFNTATLPDNAIVTAVTFKVMQQGVAGTSPFSTHGNLMMDMMKGAFGGSNALQPADFQAVASKSGIVIPNTPSAGWYARNLPAAALPFINKTGVTQLRLRFALDDNDDLGVDLLRFFSGNAVAANRPQLIIQYYIP